MLYGAAGHTGALIAKHAKERGHRPLLAGRSGPPLAALAEALGLPHRVVALENPTALRAALARCENLPYGGWVRKSGQLLANPLGAGVTSIPLPDGPCRVMPVPTGDLEAAFHATHAPDIIAYAAVPAPAALNPEASSSQTAGTRVYRSFGWARATGADGSSAQAWLETGESYAFTAAASVRAAEETLKRALKGAFSPAEAFGADFPLALPAISRLDALAAPSGG